MGHIKEKGQKPQLSKTNRLSIDIIGGDCEQFPAFSFRHLTSNSKFNFSYYGSNQENEMKEAKQSLYERIEEISKNSWLHWGSLNKQHGFETIEYSRLNILTDLHILKDEKVYIFRFKIRDKDARILGIRTGKCPIFHIIGYDFNYSAYDHGS